MAEQSSSALPSHLVSSSVPVEQPVPPIISDHQPPFLFPFQKRSSPRVTSDFERETAVLLHRISCKFLDGLAKLKSSLPINQNCEIAVPQLSFVSNSLSVRDKDVEEQNTLVMSTSDIGPSLHLGATDNGKAQQGEGAIVADLPDPGNSFELASSVLSIGLVGATIHPNTEGQIMVEPSSSPSFSHLVSSLPPVDIPLEQPSPPSPPTISKPQPRGLSLFRPIPYLRVTSEYDSDSTVFLHRLSCKFFDGIAKLKVSFQNNQQGEIAEPQLTFSSKNLSVYYDVEEQNTLVRTSFDLSPRLHLTATHDIKAHQGEMTVVADLADPGYTLELASPVPSIGLPKATLKFPAGEVSLEEREEGELEESKKALSINGIVKGQALDGVWAAQYSDEELKLRFCYKDEELSFIPSISLPSNALSLGFKRRFNPYNKLSYWYNFDTNYWSAVYKMTYKKDLKLKAGYDSEIRLGWASFWIGDENGKAKKAPMKMKVQVMMQVPQDNIKASTIMFRVKKRLDI